MSDFDFTSPGKQFSRLTLGRAEVVNARFSEVATAIASKLDKTGGSTTGDLSVGGNFSTSGTFSAAGNASFGGAVTLSGAPVLDLQAATKKYVDDGDAAKLNLSGGTMTGAIAMGGFKVTGLGTPTASGDAATKGYADSLSFSATLPGITGIASQAQAQAGTDNATVMTPLRTAQAIAALTTPAGQRNFTATGTLPNGATVVLNSDGTISTVASNNDTVGTSAVFQSTATTWVASAALSATQVVVCYYDGTSVKAIVGTISGTSVAFGTAAIISNAAISFVSVAALSSTSFAVSFYNSTAVSGVAIVGTVSATTITLGSPTSFNSAATAYISIAALSSTKVVIAFQDGGNSNYGTAIIGTVSGTTISFGSKAAWNAVTTTHINVSAITSSTFLVSYNASATGVAIIGSAPSTTISYGTGVQFFGSAVQYTSIAVLSSTSAFIAFGEGTSAGSGIIATISGTTVSFGGTKATFKANQCTFINVSKITASRVVITFADSGNGDYGTLVLGNISGNTITYETPIVFKSASSTNIGATANTANDRVFIGFRDAGNSNFGTGAVFQPAATNISSWIGITAAAISNGASGPVTILGGVNASLSGLTTNATYYYANDGTLTTTVTNYKAGRALNASSLLITGTAQ